MQTFLRDIGRFLLVLLIPTLFVVGTYFYYDPFQVVYHYNSFYVSGQPRYVTLNGDYVSMETFLNNNPIFQYNSFIFGNSRSRFFEMEEWNKYINTNKSYHFDASGESLYGICKKVNFLSEKNVPITNAIVVLDVSTLKQISNSFGHLFIKHYLLSGQNRIDFQLEFLKAYSSFSFFPAYLDFKYSGKIKDYMKRGHLLDDTPVDYNLQYNEMALPVFEKQIMENPELYYTPERKKVFFHRDSIEKQSPQVIKSIQIEMLKSIKKIFAQNNTNYKIVINPLYDQQKLNVLDLQNINAIFGKENVFNFSGINSLTSDYHNYYEESHFRPIVSQQIFKAIYAK